MTLKKIFAIVTMMLMVALSSDYAEAKRFGGSKKLGKSYKTAPTQPKSTDSKSTQTQTSPTKTSGKKGLMGGLLGGLLAGGLLAALFAGGAFEGLQMMDILIIAAIAFILFKIFKSMRSARAVNGHQGQQQPAYAAASAQPQQEPQPAAFRQAESSAQGGFGAAADEVPFNLPAGFDINGFLSGARNHYRTLQEAWNSNDLDKMREYLSPELFDEMVKERAGLSGEQHTEVMFVDAELVRADQQFGTAELSVKFTGRYRDQVENVEEDITDIWHLSRDLNGDNAPWLIVGIDNS